MSKTTKKIVCYTAITSILNLSFQPAYAGRSDLSFMSEEMSYTQKVSHHLTKKGLYKERMSDPGFEDLQAHATNAPQAPEDVVSWLFLAPLKTVIGAVSLVREGVRFALENPGKAMTMGLLLQARTATSTLSLSSITPLQGFTISGAFAGDYSGTSVSSAGDFNGDGLCDVIIGAHGANGGAGSSYLIYGAPAPSPASPSTTTPSPQSSSGAGGTSKTAAAVGGGIGAVVLVGIVGGVIAKICYFSKKDKADDTDVELVVGNPETSTSKNIGASASSSRAVSPFAPKSSGFTEHPTFDGALHGDTYEVWKTLSREEAELLRPLTSMTVPDSGDVSFILGKGNFGATYAGSNHQTQGIYAIKEVYGKTAVDESLREGEIVHSLGDHPNIISLIDYMHFEPSKKTQEPRLLQVMPLAYINGTGLRGMLSFSRDDLRERLVSDSFQQMMMGLDYIHSKGVVHLDIKADNTLYMKDGTLLIADFGRAQKVGDNDQIVDSDGLGDMRKFSPEIIALFRHFMGGNGEKVESVSGKAADIWAAGLYIWELLEDDTNNLFSTKSAPIRARVSKYTYAYFEELVENINLLKEKYSSSLLNLLRQVLTVDPQKRIRSPQVIKQLSSSAMTPDERGTTFEEVIRLGTEPAAAGPASAPVYQPADSTQYVPKPKPLPSLPATYLSAGLYPGGPGQANDNTGQMNPVFAVNQGE